MQRYVENGGTYRQYTTLTHKSTCISNHERLQPYTVNHTMPVDSQGFLREHKDDTIEGMRVHYDILRPISEYIFQGLSNRSGTDQRSESAFSCQTTCTRWSIYQWLVFGAPKLLAKTGNPLNLGVKMYGLHL